MEKMTCYRCKQLLVKTLFGISCGCAVLTGHAEEPPHGKYTFPLQSRVEITVASTGSLQLRGTSDFTSGGSTTMPLFDVRSGSTQGSG